MYVAAVMIGGTTEEEASKDSLKVSHYSRWEKISHTRAQRKREKALGSGVGMYVRE